MEIFAEEGCWGVVLVVWSGKGLLGGVMVDCDHPPHLHRLLASFNTTQHNKQTPPSSTTHRHHQPRLPTTTTTNHPHTSTHHYSPTLTTHHHKPIWPKMSTNIRHHSQPQPPLTILTPQEPPITTRYRHPSLLPHDPAPSSTTTTNHNSPAAPPPQTQDLPPSNIHTTNRQHQAAPGATWWEIFISKGQFIVLFRENVWFL